ncbi:MAG: GAF domain-containing protein [Gaiellaceae bacterium]
MATLPKSRWYGSAWGSSAGRAVIRHSSKARSRRNLKERRESTFEQAALRRIATLVAQGVQPHELFAVVAEEVGRVVDAPSVAVARYESDDTATVCGTFPKQGPLSRTGVRVPLEGAKVLSLIRDHAEPARVDDYAEFEGEIGDAVRSSGMRSSVGVPITVAGRVWGAIVMSNTEQLPEDTAARLAEFTELLAAAIANTEAREALARLADEQAALRRVATLVAEGAPPGALCRAVTDEVARVVGLPTVTLSHHHADGSFTVVAATNNPGFPVGSRWPLDGPSLAAKIHETGRLARIDDYSNLGGAVAVAMHDSSIRAAAGSPIVVDGKVWGHISVATKGAELLPAGTEQRLLDFTELLATAISNAESGDALARLADEQAALRRVATLVAKGAAPGEVFNAVAWEVGQQFDFAAVTLNRYEDDAVVVLADPFDSGFPVGSRWPFDGDSLAVRVHAARRMARIDDYSDIESSAAVRMRERASRSAIGVPIFVEGDLWGLLCVGAAASELLPADTGDRIAGFVELVGTAIANGQARDRLRLLAEEQTALRRVATLVARDAPPGEVFDAVAMEVGKLLDTDITVVGRYDGDGAATAIGSWSASPGGVPVGTRSVLGGRNVLTLVAETEKPARVEGYDDASGEASEIARRHGWRSSIAAPIIVEGRLWGVMLVATQRAEPFPAGAEDRLAAFTDLVATALANAQAHDEVRRFGEEQAALGRVATLVAGGATPEHVFKSVVDEVSSLLGLELVAFGRFDGDDTATIIAASAKYPVAPGTTWSLKDPSVIATVARTKRAARLDDYGGLKGETARVARSQAFRSAIGAPLTVEGRVWGAIIAYSTDPDPIPERSETRLGQFTELVATAVANAEARAEVHRLADEQSALRRVAVLVAQQPSPSEVFTAVTQAVGQLIGADVAALHVFQDDGAGTTIAGWSGDGGPIPPIGSRFPLVGDSVAARIFETGTPARIDSYAEAEGEGADLARRLRLRSTVGAPILVEGKLWGALLAATRGVEPWAENAETRIAAFTELVATAIANAESRNALARLADEQAALRRVATLVAQGVRPEAIFSAVGEEIGRLFGSSITTVGRFEPDGQALVAVGLGRANEGIPIGSRWELDDLLASARVFRTGHSVRVDEVDWSAVRGPLAAIGSRLGVASTVASPIFVEGRLWGVVSVSDDEQLPPEAEERLERFSELIATAIGNAESSAELAASRRRIVAAADDARRRIERDLHDGIQQRLIALTFRARAMTRKSPDELPDLAGELAEGLKDTSDELREVSRGIHPTILTEAGLGPALRALARRSAIPIDVDVSLDERLPPMIEAAAYYIASEAVTNVTKHAHANVIQLIAAHNHGSLMLEVRDDGIGGVDASRGSGILGLTDRVEALGGTISIASPPRGGTTLSVHLPTATYFEPRNAITAKTRR